MNINLLRAFLVLGAATWGAAFVGVFLPWDIASGALEGLGAKPLVYDRMLDYWLRMTSGAFGLLGGLYLLLAMRPKRFMEVIPWFGWLSLIEGAVLGFHGLRLSLPPWPFYADTAACLVSGSGTLICWRDARTAFASRQVEQVARANSR